MKWEIRRRKKLSTKGWLKINVTVATLAHRIKKATPLNSSSFSRDWKIVVIDSSQLPEESGGVASRVAASLYDEVTIVV